MTVGTSRGEGSAGALSLTAMAFYLSDFIGPFAGLTIFQSPVGMSRRSGGGKLPNNHNNFNKKSI